MKQKEFSTIEAHYATVREYNVFREALPDVTPVSTDLKNVQRPWVVSRILDTVGTGRILEIGADRCDLANSLSQRGFEVWVVDVYDRFGGGSARFQEVKHRFPALNIHRGFLHEDTVLPSDCFDAICSCSVLEHTPVAHIESTVKRIGDCLKSGGLSIHAVDFTVQGIMLAHRHINEVLRCHGAAVTAEDIAEQALSDVDTFYLSPQGHYNWRKFLDRSYEEYPYRRVTSLNLVARAHA